MSAEQQQDVTHAYAPMFTGKRRKPGVWDARAGLFHPRDYTDIELANLCRWLNERAEGYPTKIVMHD